MFDILFHDTDTQTIYSVVYRNNPHVSLTLTYDKMDKNYIYEYGVHFFENEFYDIAELIDEKIDSMLDFNNIGLIN
jgi:hypothetical protein